MISYISLFVGFVSAVIGAFLNPYKEDVDGNKSLNKWAFLFVLVPLASFTIAGISHYESQQESNKLRERIEASIDRVDAFEVQITYQFSLKEAGYSEKIKPMMREVMGIYSVITQNEDGSLNYGIAKNMYGGDNSDSEDKLLSLIDRNIHSMRDFSSPTLFVTRYEKGTPPLTETVNSAIGFGLVNIQIQNNKLHKNVAQYKLVNPRKIEAFPPRHIAESVEHWFIPDKDTEDPGILLTWRFRLYSNPAAGLRLLNDYRNSEFVLLAPRINPNYDSSPAMSAFRNRFGEIVEASVSVGGMEFSWSNSDKDSIKKLFSPKREYQETEYVGQLIHLQKK